MKSFRKYSKLTWLAAALLFHPGFVLGNNVPKKLQQRIDNVIKKAHARHLRSDANTPWVVMHAVVAFEKDLQIFDVGTDKRLNAIDYLTRHAKFDGQLIYQDRDGIPTLKTRGPGDKSFLSKTMWTSTSSPTPMPG